MGFEFSNYQSLEKDTRGDAAKANRSIPDRVDDYNLLDYVNKSSKVLDLGCNRGYFGIYLSEDIGSYMGIDSDKKQIDIGRDTIRLRNMDNCILHNEDFKGIDQKFDIILCLAFHSYVSMSMGKFGKCLLDMLNPNGYIFLEGHPPGYREEPAKYFDPLVSCLSKHLDIVHSKIILDRGLKRPFRLFYNGN